MQWAGALFLVIFTTFFYSVGAMAVLPGSPAAMLAAGTYLSDAVCAIFSTAVPWVESALDYYASGAELVTPVFE